MRSRLSRYNISGEKRGCATDFCSCDSIFYWQASLHHCSTLASLGYLIHVSNNCINRIMSITVTSLCVLGNRSRYVLKATSFKYSYTNTRNCEDQIVSIPCWIKPKYCTSNSAPPYALGNDWTIIRISVAKCEKYVANISSRRCQSH